MPDPADPVFSPGSAAQHAETDLNPDPEPRPSTQRQRVHYAPEPGTDTAGSTYRSEALHFSPPPSSPIKHAPDSPANRLGRSDTVLTTDPFSAGTIRRRTTRANSFRPVQDYDDFEARPGWQPGSEPGLDPAKPDGGHASMPTITAPCEITVVDFSHHEMSMQRFDNDSLVPFLRLPQPSWSRCRWINVKGLSWDVIQALGQHKGLHNLAIEDIMNTRNRTKADWYDFISPIVS